MTTCARRWPRARRIAIRPPRPSPPRSNQPPRRVDAVEAGADDSMSKLSDRVELVARVRSALRLKGVYDSLDSSVHVVFALAAAAEAKGPYTEAHPQRVAVSARRVGAGLGLSAS